MNENSPMFVSFGCLISDAAGIIVVLLVAFQAITGEGKFIVPFTS